MSALRKSEEQTSKQAANTGHGRQRLCVEPLFHSIGSVFIACRIRDGARLVDKPEDDRRTKENAILANGLPFISLCF